jgi:hypothetical protein
MGCGLMCADKDPRYLLVVPCRRHLAGISHMNVISGRVSVPGLGQGAAGHGSRVDWCPDLKLLGLAAQRHQLSSRRFARLRKALAQLLKRIADLLF